MNKSVPSRRSKYYLLGLVGQGQFGRVFCAVHRGTGELVALKDINRDRLPTHKFLRELRFLLSLEHPNIASCHAIEHTLSGRQLVLDYCEGGTLRNWMESRTQLSVKEGLQLVMDVLAGLEHAHSQGIVHCDIKPENILLTLTTTGWIAKISDFGVARLNQEMQREVSNTGSPAYMAPERFYNQYSEASDLYAVGVILFELLIGDRPFSGIPVDLMRAHLNQQANIPASLPNAVQSVLRRSLQKLPARRFRSATEMRAAISDLLTQWATTLATPPQRQAHLLPPAPWQATTQITLPYPITQLAVVPTTPHQGATVTPGQWIFCGHQHQLLRLHYPQGCIGPDVPPQVTYLNLAEPLCQLQPGYLGNQSACFLTAQTNTETYLSSLTVPQSQNIPPIIATLPHISHASFAAVKHWWAIGTASTGETPGYLTIGGLKQTVRTLRHSFAELLNLLILDRRYGAILTRHGLDSAFQVFTRRGQWLGKLTLSVPLGQVWQTPTPYRLLALPAGEQANFALVVDLRPFRVFRIKLPMVASLAAATDWGFVFVSEDGQLCICDRDGDILGMVQGPSHPTALAPCQSRGLILACSHDDQSVVYSVDVEQLSVGLIF